MAMEQVPVNSYNCYQFDSQTMDRRTQRERTALIKMRVQ